MEKDTDWMCRFPVVCHSVWKVCLPAAIHDPGAGGGSAVTHIVTDHLENKKMEPVSSRFEGGLCVSP